MVVVLAGALRVVAAFVVRVPVAGGFAAVVLLAAAVLVVAVRAVVFDAVLAGAAFLTGEALVSFAGGGGAEDDALEAFEGGDAGLLGGFDLDRFAGGRVMCRRPVR